MNSLTASPPSHLPREEKELGMNSLTASQPSDFPREEKQLEVGTYGLPSSSISTNVSAEKWHHQVGCNIKEAVCVRLVK
jgi:hypothetical protein